MPARDESNGAQTRACSPDINQQAASGHHQSPVTPSGLDIETSRVCGIERREMQSDPVGSLTPNSHNP